MNLRAILWPGDSLARRADKNYEKLSRGTDRARENPLGIRRVFRRSPGYNFIAQEGCARMSALVSEGAAVLPAAADVLRGSPGTLHGGGRAPDGRDGVKKLGGGG